MPSANLPALAPDESVVVHPQDEGDEGEEGEEFGPIPGKVFDREVGQVVSIADLFVRDEAGNYIDLNTSGPRGAECSLKYRVPDHQRYHKKSRDAKITIIDSVWKNYIIGGLALSRHPDNEMCFYLNIEDGQSRLNIIQDYLDDKFKYRGAYFSQRTTAEKKRFTSYQFNMDITMVSRTRSPSDEVTTTADHYYENFDRINRGAKLEDNDKYWCKKNKPVCKLAIDFIGKAVKEYPFMLTKTFGVIKDGKQCRAPLQEIVAMIGALYYDTYKLSYSRHYEKIGEAVTPEKKKTLYDFMNWYKGVHDKMFAVFPREHGEQSGFNKPGRFQGMMVMDYKKTTVHEDLIGLEEKKQKWVEILNIDRCSDDFMKGTKTIWNTMSGGNKSNQEEGNIKARLTRVDEFYFDATPNREVTVDKYSIKWSPCEY